MLWAAMLFPEKSHLDFRCPKEDTLNLSKPLQPLQASKLVYNLKQSNC